ncbi:hypothetical protein HMJ29_07330 [Hymenobacter taeanensis]|uniref:Uncharacterized protein n=1 Tax=Hymenobacter taeanensis TaxID=2735321 RepID=A0A6M6BFJ1_9BACT|nr:MULTISPECIES: hypothetical protein [Hymenobacter]QJX46760.1 hypothetical protein HMJ29_07330 [Hymenobacter taeanensis]UOQ80628.1 hypothetical protein MUN83_17675 [Hymenobacter sp. 5414T-23]
MAIDPNKRPVRVINDDTTDQELAAGHIIPGADPPKNESARGGFGNRDGKEGYGTDSESGITAVAVNENTDDAQRPKDNMRSNEEGREDLPNQDMPQDRDPDLQPRRPVDELDADDDRPGKDEMRNPNSRVGMGQMEQRQPNNDELARRGTNADLTDRNATDTAIDQ